MEKKKLKILVIHTKYREKGGEDIAVEKEIKLLEKSFQLKKLFLSNESNLFISIFVLIFQNNFKFNRILKKEINSFKPDIVYIHNTWFIAGLKFFEILKKKDINYVIKLHNFRYDCTNTFDNSKHYLNKDFCMSCGQKYNNKSRFNKYFQNSYLKTISVLMYGKKYLKILQDSKTNIFVLTKFHKEYLSKKYNITKKINIIPNYLDVKKNQFNKDTIEKYFIYAGRISDEKGINELIKSFIAANLNGVKLYIVGTGPKETYLKDLYKNNNVAFLGYKDNPTTLGLIFNSSAVITNTKMFEGQPTLLCEAALLKVPVIFPKNGGISEFFPENYPLKFDQNKEGSLTKIFTDFNNYNSEKLALKNFKFISSKLNKNLLAEQFQINFLNIILQSKENDNE